MNTDAKAIDALGGPAKVAAMLGYDTSSGGIQRVANWKRRGIPAHVRADHPEIFGCVRGASKIPQNSQLIRLPEAVYEFARSEATSMSRTLAQQLEHWIRLAVAIEAAGVTIAQVQKILAGDLRARERAMVKLGLATKESMYLIPPEAVRGMKVAFPSGDVLDAR